MNHRRRRLIGTTGLLAPSATARRDERDRDLVEVSHPQPGSSFAAISAFQQVILASFERTARIEPNVAETPVHWSR